jgi:AcrR family transcriptional regulator
MTPTNVNPAAVQQAVIPKAKTSRVRDRIVQTARELFYRHGIRAVGVDAIACEAGTNKMSFYRHFTSKDQLVAEYLRDQGKDSWLWWDEIVQRHAGDPRQQIETLFDTHVTRTCADGSRGCALANAAVEISDPAHPARLVVEEYKAEMRRRIRALAADLGARDSDGLGDALMLLMEGSYLTRLSFSCKTGPAAQAAQAARLLMDAYTRTG